MTKLDPEIERKVRASFAAQSLMQTFEAQLTEVGTGAVEIAAPIVAGARQQHGFGHAGLTVSLADSAAGYAALTTMPAEAEVLTVELKINLLAPAQGDRLIARGHVIKPGRRLVIVGAEVFAETGSDLRQISLFQGTMIPV